MGKKNMMPDFMLKVQQTLSQVPDNIDQFLSWLPAELRALIEEAAKTEGVPVQQHMRKIWYEHFVGFLISIWAEKQYNIEIQQKQKASK